MSYIQLDVQICKVFKKESIPTGDLKIFNNKNKYTAQNNQQKQDLRQ